MYSSWNWVRFLYENDILDTRHILDTCTNTCTCTNWHLQSNKQAIYRSNFIGAISFTGPGGLGGGGTVGNKALTTPFFTIWRCLQPLYSCSVPTRKSQLPPLCASCSLCLFFLFRKRILMIHLYVSVLLIKSRH